MRRKLFDKKIFKIALINLIFIAIILLIFELSLGHWFKKDHFGFNMRGKRLQKIDFSINNNKFKKNWTYRRDYYGFREDYAFDDKYDLSKIKIVFNGGSTGDEKILPYEETIVGNLNRFLANSNLDIKIFNASLQGKSLVGKINDFNHWFNKLENFNPKIMIFYMGINDRKIAEKNFTDNNEILSFKQYIINLISQRSFIWGFARDIKYSFFNVNQNLDGYYIFYGQEKPKNSFISYKKAKKLYKKFNVEEQKIVKNYKKNLEKLKYILDKKKILPIFITQIRHDGNGERILFKLNEELKNFALSNNYSIIQLDELINSPISDLFVDDYHTNQEGSLYISKKIFPYLKKIIETNLSENN
tara:strand:+ start:1752 stop:2828 length:1077 start_codon:yes stop_codon:yes gene_type:complete